MEDGGAPVPGEFQQVVVGHGFGTRPVFAGDVARKRARGGEAAREAHAGHRGRAVVRRRQVVGLDRRRGQRLGRLRADVPARLGVQLAHRQRESGERVHRRSGHVRGQRGQVELHVGARQRGIGAREHAALVDADGHRPRAREHVAHPHRRLAPPRLQRVVGRDRLRAAEDHPQLQVILEVLAHARQRVDDGDAERLQHRGRADPRELQQHRRLHRAGGDDDLAAGGDGDVAPALPVGHARRPAAVRQDPRCLRLGGHGQVRPAARGAQVGDRGRAAEAVARGELVVAGAFLRRTVEVVVARNPDLGPGRDQRLDQLVLRADVGHPQRAVGAVPLARAAHVVLEPAEVREHVGVRPARVAERGPAVVVVAMAANVDEPVDRARPAQRAAARPVDLATVHPGIGVRLEHPVVDRMEHRLGIPDRHVDPRVAVARARLEEQHRAAGVLGQPVGEHAAGGAAADDDGVPGRVGHREGARCVAGVKAAGAATLWPPREVQGLTLV